jgi:zinc transporter ZupT
MTAATRHYSHPINARRYSQEWLSRYEDASFEELSGADARKALLIVGVMAAHALGEGSGVGVSFSGNRGWAQGTLVTIAIGLHNIPGEVGRRMRGACCVHSRACGDQP